MIDHQQISNKYYYYDISGSPCSAQHYGNVYVLMGSIRSLSVCLPTCLSALMWALV